MSAADPAAAKARPKVPKPGRLQYLSLKRDVLLTRHATTNHWLIASLLAVNSAGLIALTGVDEADTRLRLTAFTAFLAGTILSLICGYASRLADGRELRAISQFLAAHPGQIDGPEAEVSDELKENAGPAETMARWAVGWGWASLAAFLLGIALTAVALANAQAAGAAEMTCKLGTGGAVTCRLAR